VSNAARLLASKLEQWTLPPGHTAHEVRRGKETNEYRHTAEAVQLVQTIDLLLSGLNQAGADVASFQECLDAWYSAAMHTETHWGSADQTRRPCISTEDLRALKMLASYLDTAGLPTYETDLLTMDDALTQVRHLVDEAATLPRAVKAYIYGLLNQIAHLMANPDGYSDDMLRRATLELVGALDATAATPAVPARSKPKWQGVAAFLVATVAAPMFYAAGDVGAGWVHELGPSRPVTGTIERPADEPPPQIEPPADAP
jgi:hypothetical protein